VVDRTTAARGCTLRDLRESGRPLTFYLSIPFGDQDRLRPLSRLLVRQVLDHCTQRQAGHLHRLLLLIDEMPALKRLPVLSDGLNFLAGYGVHLCLITPSLNSLVQLYGPHHNFLDRLGNFIFRIPGEPRPVRMKTVGEGGPVNRWTERMRRGTTAAPQTCNSLNSVCPDACRTLAGLERLQADLCRALGRVHPRPSALPDSLLQWPRGQDARVWQPGQDGRCCVPLPALWPRHAPGVDALEIVVVFAVCQSLCGQLGEPGEPSAPRGSDLSPHSPDSPSHVPHDFLPKRCGVVERLDALWRPVHGGFLARSGAKCCKGATAW
jgi:hypothetical protein